MPRTATVTASLDSVIYEIRRADLEPIMQRRPELADALAAVMAERLAYNDEFGHARQDEAPVMRDDLLGRLRALFGLASR